VLVWKNYIQSNLLVDSTLIALGICTTFVSDLDTLLFWVGIVTLITLSIKLFFAQKKIRSLNFKINESKTSSRISKPRPEHRMFSISLRQTKTHLDILKNGRLFISVNLEEENKEVITLKSKFVSWNFRGYFDDYYYQVFVRTSNRRLTEVVRSHELVYNLYPERKPNIDEGNFLDLASSISEYGNMKLIDCV
jgi:hypothetical protein